MSNALTAGVSGLQAHQTMIDVAGNNLANLSTYGFKTSRVMFADLLSRTSREASQPFGNVGGTNPVQIGSGVEVAGTERDLSQGNLVSTGRELDLAIEGKGFFVLYNGDKSLYTRVGTFAVDTENYLVDPATGYRVQRIGNTGEEENFQDPSIDHIRIPYDVGLTGKETASVRFNGNLSADSTEATTTTMRGGLSYTTGSSTANGSTLLADLNEASSLTDTDTIRIFGTDASDGAVDTNFNITTATSTLQDLLDAVSAAYTGSTAYLSNGEVYLKDDVTGFSKTDVNLEYNGTGTFGLSNYFSYQQVGGEATKSSTIEVFDAQGVSRTMALSFVRQDTTNKWDMIVNSVTGDLDDGKIVTRRIEDIAFDTDGSYLGIGSTDQPHVEFQFQGTGNQVVNMDLGTIGQFDGLTQFGGAGTAAANEQDGYESGRLSSLSVSPEGEIVGVFTNGIIRSIATLNVAVFQNDAGLKAVGGNYYIESPNSGQAVNTRALSGGAGSVRGGYLESSNVDMAEEFVTLISAQRGFQANARTITVGDQMLRELTNLIR